MATEIADHEKLRQELKLFLQLYTSERNEITLGLLKQTDWDDYLDKDTFLMMFSKEKPPKNYDMVLKLIQFIKTRISTITWDDDFTQALEDAFLASPKISKNIIKGMCDVTKTTFLDKEQEIDFLNLLDGLIEKALTGTTFLCSKVQQSMEMARRFEGNHQCLY